MTAQQDRRDAGTQRIPFEAIIEIGADGAPAFEAESVDVSTGGMHLRTAYLPELGQPLVCRFDDGEGKAIAAEGNVVWREERPRGGEFGVRFTNVDGSSTTALLDMCGLKPASDADVPAAAPASPPADRGTRVRLHIDGLGSPMKARVREANPAEVRVGSNLEFLRVGRALELEDVDRGKRRTAHIERVEVEVDPASRVPQLVVALRYDDAPPEQPQVAGASGETTPDPVTVDPLDDGSRAPVTMRTRSASEAAEDPIHDDEVEAAHLMKSGLSRAADRVGPAIANFGAHAKTTLALLFAKARERGGRATESELAPRRTTAPPPTGALHATGKRVVRAEAEGEELVEQAIAPKKKLRAVAIGGAAGVAAVLLAVALHKPSAPPAGAAAANALVADPAATAAAAAEQIPGAPDTVTANVPLFGPTTLSTTEPVLPPAPPASGAAPFALEATAATAQTPGVAGPAPTGVDPFAEAGGSASAFESDSSESSEPKPAAEKKISAFTQGKLIQPTQFRVRTDGSIAAMHGTRLSTGFTVLVPGRRATETANAIASKDPRIASTRVSNGAKGAEITFKFKGSVPAYAVRAKGRDLLVSLGRGDKDVKASKDDKGRKTSKEGKEGRHATAKRGERGAKAR